MFKLKWLGLQLFGGEGAAGGGGEGASAGDSSSADAGQSMESRLLELGVPADKIRKRAKYAAPAPAARKDAAPVQNGEGQAAAAEAPVEDSKTEKAEDAAPARMSWDDIMADPEYNQKMQETMQARLRKAKGAEETLAKLTPALELLARKFGLDAQNLDAEALNKAISDDDEFYEAKAVEMGVSVETAKKLDQEERSTARKQREEALTLEEQKIQQHFIHLEQQAEALKAKFPTMDLRAELRNPAFARMTAPNVGISVEDAYYAVHRAEIQAAQQAAVAQTTAQNLSRAIQSGQKRPDESGSSGQAPSTTTFNYANASPAERKAFKEHLRTEAAAGRKVYPGSYPGR